ncbi:MAG: asparagine synthase (glutamine-hydrolyzing) [Coriobacteriia bacterium]|nr:asparagine synthase (glutamine-hydrolyzing) [Coriobacteriia bacterium]
MSGFVGFTGDFASKHEAMDAMLEAIAHRGPDGSTTHFDDYLSLGFRELALCKSAPNAQPVFSADGNKLIVFDGEIYNRELLQARLSTAGYVFGTGTSAEVVLAAYEEYGSKFLNELRGMWSFVIYDRKARTLFGSRDRFGIKPFYYSVIGDNLLFGSEVKSFLPHPDFTPAVNTRVLGTYLNFGFVPGTNTIFADVCKLAPGHYFEYVNDTMTINEYHRFNFEPDNSRDFDDWARSISGAITESVDVHKAGSVDVGSFLSGGIDSSYLAKVANDIKPTKTFSVGYTEEQYSELPYAQAFAKRFNIENFAKDITSDMYFDIARTVVHHLDEPLADPSCLSLYYVCANARQHVTATFSGEGADEMFAGYNPYRDGLRMDKYNRIPLTVRKAVAAAARALPSSVPGRNFFIRGAKSIEQRYFQAGNFIFDPSELDILLLDNNSITPEEVVAPFYAQTESAETVSRMQAIDLNVWGPGDIMLKADKMSMANSLQVRCPLCDIEVLNLALQIPAKHKVSKADTKISLRAAARLDGIDDATAGKKKLGFPVPLRDWLRRDEYSRLVQDVCNSEVASRYFNVDILNKMIDDHKSGTADTYRKIWAVYIFLLWHEVFIGPLDGSLDEPLNGSPSDEN